MATRASAVREARPGLPDLLTYTENACSGNAGFLVPRSAVAGAHSGKVIFDPAQLGLRVREALANARTAEDPSCTAPVADAHE